MFRGVSYGAGVPVTFLAHQAPVLPLARRWPRAFDGVALVAGSMAPDLADARQGSRFDTWAHGFPGVVAFCLPVACAITWLVVRVLAPVVPPVLPDLGPFHGRDYRGLAVHRFGRIATPLSALIGALSHVALDSFTHGWGWFAEHLDWYAEPLNTSPILGRQWTPFRIMQYVGHVVLSAYALWWLWRQGSRRWLADRARLIPGRTSRRGTLILAIGLVAGGAMGLAWAASGPVWLGWATGVMRVSVAAFVGLVLAAWIARPRSPQDPRRPVST